jgi:hypothetical protein
MVPASPLAKTYASIATTAAATPMIWAAVRAPTSTTSPVIAIPQPAIRPSVISSAASGLASNAPLAGLLASTVSKLSATAIQNDARPWEYVELVYIGLTRAAVLASAALTTDSFPKYVAGGILAADIAALSAQESPVVRAVLHNLGSTGAALYLGGLASVQEERSFGAAALFLVSTVLHALSATQ